MNRISVKMPFRIDLVMGGVSDLEFWSNMNGDCLSLTCNIQGRAIEMFGNLIETEEIILKGFDKENIICYKISDIPKIDISGVKTDLKMGVAALKVGLSIISEHGTKIDKGFYITNNSIRQKGLGGSTLFATALITLLCKLYNLPKLSINSLVNYVMKAESICGSNGGWEDVLASYFKTVNRVKYRPNNEQKYNVESPYLGMDCTEFLHNNLLLLDTKIKISTKEILDLAYDNFINNKNKVIAASNEIAKECDIVLKAIENKNIEYVGQSLTKQREQWSIITKGLSKNNNIDEVLEDAKKNIYGYKETGAGGGGTLLIVCKENMKSYVTQMLCEKGFEYLDWDVSEYGLNIQEKK